MRCSTVSKVLGELLQTKAVDKFPSVVVRLAGVESREATQQLQHMRQEFGAPFHCYTDLESAAQQAVTLAAAEHDKNQVAQRGDGLLTRLQGMLSGRRFGGNSNLNKATETDVDSR